MGDKSLKKKYINALQVGERVNDYFVATGATLTPFRPESGKSGCFLRCTLSDRSGSLPAIMWEGGEDVFPRLQGNAIVRVLGTVGQYRGELQVVVDRLTTAVGSVDPSCFLPQAPRSRQEMEKELQIAIKKVQTEPLSWLLNDLFSDQSFYRHFIQAPAAKNVHHAYLGGLLEHTLETFCFATVVANRYPEYINRDLLFTGAILHDCGKIIEYEWEGLAFSLTDQGRLFGHLVLGAKLVEERIGRHSNFPVAIKQELIHMILSHHGTQEWGSPQPPKTINAFALHHVDYLSSELNHFQGLLDGASASASGLWTAMDWKLGRSVFRGFLSCDNAAAAREGED